MEVNANLQQQMIVAALRKELKAGPPPEPTNEKPGPALAAFREALTAERAARALQGQPELSPVEVVELFAHLVDRNNWRAQMAEFNEKTAMLKQAETRVHRVSALFPGGKL